MFQKLLEENPQTENFIFRNCKNLKHEDIETLIELLNPELRTLSIHYCRQFNDELVDKLADHCTKLTNLTFSGCFKDLTKTGLASITQKCQELRFFSILSCESDEIDENENDADADDVEWSLDDELFEALIIENQTLSLQHFGISGFKSITSNGLQKFVQNICSTLTSLDLSEIPAITDTTLQEIAKLCPKLQTINCGYCDITDNGVEDFCSKCVSLQSVDFCGCNQLTDKAISSLANHCPDLKIIKLGWCLKLTEKSLEVLSSNCPNLESVDIRHCSVKHIPYSFVKLSLLKELLVEGCTGLKCPPLDVTLNGVKATKQFLEESNLHCMCRVAFIGEEGSGKSSLAMCMVSSSLAVADSSTEGVHVLKWRPFNESSGMFYTSRCISEFQGGCGRAGFQEFWNPPIYM